MIEIKTLKELEEHNCANWKQTSPQQPLIHSGELKQEAIKLIKELRDGNYDVLPFYFNDSIGMILLLKHLFNIKDKDIK